MIGVRVWSNRYQGVQTSIFDFYRQRVIADGGVVEAFTCTISKLRLPALNVGQFLFDNYDARVVADSGSVEAEQCTINNLNNLNKWVLY